MTLLKNIVVSVFIAFSVSPVIFAFAYERDDIKQVIGFVQELEKKTSGEAIQVCEFLNDIVVGKFYVPQAMLMMYVSIIERQDISIDQKVVKFLSIILKKEKQEAEQKVANEKAHAKANKMYAKQKKEQEEADKLAERNHLIKTVKMLATVTCTVCTIVAPFELALRYYS